MLKHSVFCVVVCVALGSPIVPYDPTMGGMGMGMGMYPPPGVIPVQEYGPVGYGYMRPRGVSASVGQGNQFYGDGSNYNGFYGDGIQQQAVKDVGQIGSQGGQGYSGGHQFAQGAEGGQGFKKGTFGGRFNKGSNDFNGAEKYRGTAAKDGFDGYGQAGHKKGHRTTGFHKSYHNVESGKDTQFVDEDHDTAGKAFGQSYGDNMYGNEGFKYNGGSNNGQFGENMYNDVITRGGNRGEGMSSGRYDSQGGNGYYNNQDRAYKNLNLMSHRNDNLGRGQTGMNGGGYYNVRPSYNDLWY